MASVLMIGLIMILVLFIGFAVFVLGFLAKEFIKTIFLKVRKPKDYKETMNSMPPDKEIIGKEVLEDDTERIRKSREFDRLRKFADSKIEERERGNEERSSTNPNKGDYVERGPIPADVNSNFEQSIDRTSRNKKRFKINRFSDD